MSYAETTQIVAKLRLCAHNETDVQLMRRCCEEGADELLRLAALVSGYRGAMHSIWAIANASKEIDPSQEN